MDKQRWSREAIAYIDSLNTQEFENFLLDCIPHPVIVKTAYKEIKLPAIAYPLMRSFINTITVNSSLNPVIIPTINFQELIRQRKRND